MTVPIRYFANPIRSTISFWMIPLVICLLCPDRLRAQVGPITYPAVLPATVDEVPRSMGPMNVIPMTLGQRFSYYEHQTYSPMALISPLVPAGIIMWFPPRGYPRRWRDGGEALGRNFGSSLATELSANTAKFLTATLTHEDPRYFPARRKGVVHRTLYALAFTIVDRSDTGRPRLALSNFAGTAAAAFVGNAYLPKGFEDSVHVWQRAGGTLGGYLPTLLVGYADGNIMSEYKPELRRLGHWLHLPLIAK
jgi:hypothetical protein